MLTTALARWIVRLLTLVVWAVLGVSVVFWGLRLGAQAVSPPLIASAGVPKTVDSSAVARVLGGVGASTVSAAVSATSRLVLTGVVARNPSHTGAALIALDGKPAKAFSVGSKIEDGLFLISVAGRRASLGPGSQGPVTMTLELPPPRF